MFSNQNNKQTFVLTPLGAATVEAMPDRKKVDKVNKDWKQKRFCPTSAIFPTPRLVRDFYVARGMVVVVGEVNFTHRFVGPSG